MFVIKISKIVFFALFLNASAVFAGELVIPKSTFHVVFTSDPKFKNVEISIEADAKKLITIKMGGESDANSHFDSSEKKNVSFANKNGLIQISNEHTQILVQKIDSKIEGETVLLINRINKLDQSIQSLVVSDQGSIPEIANLTIF